MDSVVALVSAGVPGVSNKKDDDVTDRLSSRYTVIMILVFAAVITLQLYLGSPLTCWAPVHFTFSHMMYANSYCWIRNTYYLPFNQSIPNPNSEEYNNRQVVPYYQWIPFILLLQALFFYLPSIVWHGLNQQGGIDADNILQAAGLMTLADKEEQRQALKMLLTNQIDRFLGTRRRRAIADSENMFKKCFSSVCGVCGRRFGAYLVILYMVTKLLYIANVIGQFFVLNSVLGTSFNTYGFEVMQNMVRDHDWMSLPHVVFPRVTMCDFEVRRLGNLHRYTLQCALRINMYNEKIFVFLWFWFFFVALFTVLSTLVWLCRFVFKSDRRTFISNHLYIRRKLQTDKDRVLVDEFVFDHLKQDGVFLLRLISHNTNNITTTDLVCAMWDSFKERRQKRLDAAAAAGNHATTIPTAPTSPNHPGDEKKPLVDSTGTYPVLDTKVTSENEKTK